MVAEIRISEVSSGELRCRSNDILYARKIATLDKDQGRVNYSSDVILEYGEYLNKSESLP
jgi:hypothetical protein